MIDWGNITDLVNIIQSKISMGASGSDIISEVNKLDEFAELHNLLKRYSKHVIANVIKQYSSYALEHVDDIWQEFSLTRFQKAILNFDETNKSSFKTFMCNSIAQCTISYLRKLKPHIYLEAEKDNSEFNVLISHLYNNDDIGNAERRIALVSFLTQFISILNMLNTDIIKILVYHSNKILTTLLQYDPYIIMEKWDGSPFKGVTCDMEAIYAKYLSPANEKDVMGYIADRTEREGKAELKWQTPDNNKVNYYTAKVKELLFKHQHKMLKLRMELTNIIAS